MGENDVAAAEAVTEQNNEVDVAPATEASDDSSASSGADESASAVTETNEPSGDADSAAQPSADSDTTVSSTDGNDPIENSETENTATANDDSNGESENSEAATTAATTAAPQDDNAGSTNENVESSDNAADTTSDATATAEATTAAPVEEDPSSTASPTTEAPEFKCDSVGRFACSHSCEKYYFCWDTTGDHAVFECPHHRAFDPITQLCVHNFAVCAAAPKCEVDRQVSPNPDDKTTFFECKLEENDDEDEDSTETFEVRKHDCADGREFDANLGYCAIVPQDDGSSDENSGEKQDCTEAGIFIDFSNESRYYECTVKSVSKGKLKLHHHKCPKYHVFSMEDKKCIPLLPVTA